MANIILTTKNNRTCTHLPNYNTEEDMSKENFIKAVKLISTGFNGLNLTGGEPLLHGHITNIINYLMVTDTFVQVFTGGIVDEELIKSINNSILNKRYDKISFGIEVSVEDDLEKQAFFMRTLNKYTFLSCTINDKNKSLLYLIDLVNKYELQNTIRLGLSLPVFGGSKEHIKLEDYNYVAKNIMELVKYKGSINIVLDCGFPLCMFSVDDINLINKDEGNIFSFECSHPIDIYPDLSIVNCNSLKHIYKTKVDDFNNLQNLFNNLSESLATAHGIYEKRCLDCRMFRRVCFGGCKGFYKPIGGDKVDI